MWLYIIRESCGKRTETKTERKEEIKAHIGTM
jgi:hypothetical protein